MAITTRDGLIKAMGNDFDKLMYNKATQVNALPGNIFSLWTLTGIPGAGSNPTTAAVPTNATTGAIPFTNQTAPAKAYLPSFQVSNSTVSGSNLDIHDRIAHMGGLSGTVTTAQTVGIDLLSIGVSSDRLGAADYSDVIWYIEVYTDMGATSVTAICAVTYDDGSNGNLTAISLGVSPRKCRMFQLLPAVAGRNIRAVNTVTLSATTGTAGNFGVTATRQMLTTFMTIINGYNVYDWASLGLPYIPNDACLFGVVLCQGISSGQFYAFGKFVYG